MTATLAIACVGSYLAGSIPFGVWAARSKGIDIFQFGSGNPGATNVSRALGKTWGMTVFVLDILKGLAPAIAARFLFPDPVGPLHAQAVWFLVGLFAVAGHCASPFLGFRGGKGIATSLGVGLGAAPSIALSAFGIFLGVFAVTRYVSLASIVAVIAAVLLSWIIPGQAPELSAVYVLLSIFVVYRHRGNIRRLREGKEPKFSFRKSAAPAGTPASDGDGRKSQTAGNGGGDADPSKSPEPSITDTEDAEST